MNIMTRPHSVLLISAFQDENNKLFGQLRLETNHTYLYSISYEAQDRHRRREKEGREGGGEGRELEQLHASARNNLRPGDSLSSALASNWMITPPSPSRLELIRNPTVCAPPLPDPSSLLLIWIYKSTGDWAGANFRGAYHQTDGSEPMSYWGFRTSFQPDQLTPVQRKSMTICHQSAEHSWLHQRWCISGRLSIWNVDSWFFTGAKGVGVSNGFFLLLFLLLLLLLRLFFFICFLSSYWYWFNLKPFGIA